MPAFQTQQHEKSSSLPPVPLGTAIANKNWEQVKSQIQKSIENRTFKKEELLQALAAGADLSGLDLRDIPAACLNGSQIRGGKLSGARMPALKDVSFDGVAMDKVDIRDVTLTRVSFKNCSMQDAYLTKANLSNVSFVGKDSMRRAKIFESALSDVKFDVADLNGAQFFDSDFSRVSFSSQSLLGASIISMRLNNCDFSKADLRACDVVLSTYDDNTRWNSCVITGRERMPENFALQRDGAKLGDISGVQAKTTKSAWRNFSARAGNPVKHIRSQLLSLAAELSSEKYKISEIDGRGTKIIHIEQVPDQFREDETPKHTQHSRTVRNRMIAAGHSGGLATGADYSLVDLDSDYLTGAVDFIRKDTIEDLRQALFQEASVMKKALTTKLADIASEQKKPGTKRADAIVVSMGVSRSTLYARLQSLLDEDDFPEMCSSVFGEDSRSLSKSQRQQRIIDFVDSQVRPEQNESMATLDMEYIKQLNTLWEQGTIVVISAGNDRALRKQFEGETASSELKYQANPELNLLVRSPVLSVAASESNSTPDTVEDDLISEFSSRGESAGAHPGISAGGESVLIGYEIADGTSFSAPMVASCVSLMRQINPEASAEEIVEVMKSTAFDSEKHGTAEEGSGQLRVIKALRRIFELKRSD